MASDRVPTPYLVTVVSCDILGHSSADSQRQVASVAAINKIVADMIDSCELGDVVWSSGGDGGHVVFRQKAWQQRAVDLVLDLHRWSQLEGVSLRIVCHRGPVAHVRGADGRVQMVGEGMNFAGWLLGQVSREGVVVSEAFRRGVEVTDVVPAVEFHGERYLPNVDFRPQLLYLMSTRRLRSSWIGPEPGDRAGLDLAMRQGDGWDVIYFAKRIWQANSADRDVERALESVQPRHLRYNDLFGDLRSDELNEVLRLGQLVERRRGDLICRYNDPGDTLFVILRGEVGVFRSEGEGFEAEPKHRARQGAVVGELAYALGRNRTADLVALTDVALLSFNNEELRPRLAGSKVDYRVLEHVADNVPYLLGPRRTGPLAVREGFADERPLSILRHSCHLVTVPTGKPEFALEDLGGGRGLYILVAGEVAASGVPLDGKDFPPLWVDLPDILSVPSTNCPPKVYTVRKAPVKVLWIEADAIHSFGDRQLAALRRALLRAVRGKPDKYEYDVYLCHAKQDRPVIDRICARLTEADITCWLDDEHVDPSASSIDQGLRSSRFLLVCVSSSFARSAWAQEEMRVALHLDVKRRADDRSVLVLVLDEDAQDEVVPDLFKDRARTAYAKTDDFERLIEHIVSRSR